ncbi:hypothetical protein [Actinomyces urogenitalis]|uniref:hypothetical protein n=1 Tax=Actinomyces urogenitalis TaxID=103621 RepID=UPI00242CF554|nr:hypothetical protein [Actinomyces urogenitalis]MCI7456370.1 hypothetical protein [Actinomyces urogenitalis]
MFATLLKEELLSKGRTYLQIVAILAATGLGASVIGAVPALLGAEVLTTFTGLASVVAFIVAVPIVAVSELIDYWQSMYGQRGYLTMTVPARGREVFGAKVVFGLAATLLAMVFAALGVSAAVMVSAWLRGVEVASLIAPLRGMVEYFGAGFVWGFATFLILQLLSWMVIIEAVMSIGAQARWNRMGAGAPVIGVLAVYLIGQVLTVAAIIVVPVGLDLPSHQIVWEGSLPSMVATWGTGEDPSVLGLGFLPVPLVLAAVLAWRAVPAIEKHTSLR